MEGKKLYTLLVYSENIAGILNQITAVFTRRQVNIESLNVSASSIPGLHKYTITAWSDEDQIVKITKQIEKKIDVVKAKYYTDDELFFRETGLYKLSTATVLDNPDISRTIRKHGASIVEVNPTYVIVMLNGMTAVPCAQRLRLRVPVHPLGANRRNAQQAGGGEHLSRRA